MIAVDWVAVSSIVTAGATLVLAFATFAAVRSGNRTARVAERSLLAGRRPLLERRPPQPALGRYQVPPVPGTWFGVSGTSRGLLVGALRSLVLGELLRRSDVAEHRVAREEPFGRSDAEVLREH